MTPEQQFWATITHKRDQGLAHITGLIERSGVNEFLGFMNKHILPAASGEPKEDELVEYVVAHCAIVGAVEALLAWRDKQEAAQ